jgi:hypothetical protein
MRGSVKLDPSSLIVRTSCEPFKTLSNPLPFVPVPFRLPPPQYM